MKGSDRLLREMVRMMRDLKKAKFSDVAEYLDELHKNNEENFNKLSDTVAEMRVFISEVEGGDKPMFK